MVRQYYGDFAQGISDAELGTALAWLAAASSARELFTQHPTPRGRLSRGNPYPGNPFWTNGKVAAEFWRALASTRVAPDRPTRFGLAVAIAALPRPSLPEGLDPVKLARTIAEGELVSAVHIITATAEAPAEWLSLLDLACFGDDWEDRARDPVGLLVIPQPLEAALERVLARRRPPLAQAVLVLGGHSGDGGVLDSAENLRAVAQADVVGVARVPPEQHAALLESLLADLALDLDLDVAFTHACRASALEPPLLIAREHGFDRAHTSCGRLNTTDTTLRPEAARSRTAPCTRPSASRAPAPQHTRSGSKAPA